MALLGHVVIKTWFTTGARMRLIKYIYTFVRTECRTNGRQPPCNRWAVAFWECGMTNATHISVMDAYSNGKGYV